jgi:hypothetical protein
MSAGTATATRHISGLGGVPLFGMHRLRHLRKIGLYKVCIDAATDFGAAFAAMKLPLPKFAKTGGLLTE